MQSHENRMNFQQALSASTRSPEIPESEDIYGWLLGTWELDVLRYRVDLSGEGIRGEAHFVRVLEGRAVQDVWIMPRFRGASKNPERRVNTYGATIRLGDAAIRAWRVTWFNPASGARDELIGRWSGKNIVQIGAHSDGAPIRWSFTEITEDSFRWTGEALEPDGATWKMEAEFRGRRRHE